jgi:hypothetical protein
MTTTAHPAAPTEVRTIGRTPAAALSDEPQTANRVARLTQIALGLLWLLDGALQFQPYMFGKTFITGVILPNAVGQPGVIATPITWIAHLIAPHVAFFNAFAAGLEVLIGLGLLYRPTVRPALLASFAWALGIWFVGEGFGLIATGSANALTGAPGAALLYVLVGTMCWPRRDRSDARLGLIGERGANAAFAVLWLGAAAIWLLPANSGTNSTGDAILAVPTGAGWLSSILSSAARASAGHGTAIALSAASLSVAIGLAVLRGWHPRPFLVLAIAISLLYWVLGQGLGGIFTGSATDVGAGPLMILIAAVLLARARTAGRPSGSVLRSPTRRAGLYRSGPVRPTT